MRDGNKTQENLGESEVYGLDYICPVSFLKGICPLRVLSDTCDEYWILNFDFCFSCNKAELNFLSLFSAFWTPDQGKTIIK